MKFTKISLFFYISLLGFNNISHTYLNMQSGAINTHRMFLFNFYTKNKGNESSTIIITHLFIKENKEEDLKHQVWCDKSFIMKRLIYSHFSHLSLSIKNNLHGSGFSVKFCNLKTKRKNFVLILIKCENQNKKSLFLMHESTNYNSTSFMF